MNDVPPEVKAVSVDAVVRRLHMNVGNPTQRESPQRTISKHMITAVKHLHCASCVRTKPAKTCQDPRQFQPANPG